MNKCRLIVIIETLIIFLLGLVFVTQVIDFSWAQEEVFMDCQPESINFNSYDPYCLLVIDKLKTFGTKREIWITKSVDHNYGYVINYPSSYYYVWDKKVTMETNVDWNDEGVSLNTYDLELFIPKEKFIGGR